MPECIVEVRRGLVAACHRDDVAGEGREGLACVEGENGERAILLAFDRQRGANFIDVTEELPCIIHEADDPDGLSGEQARALRRESIVVGRRELRENEAAAAIFLFPPVSMNRCTVGTAEWLSGTGF